ncbi:MAG TPA: discoidin domain-containing protein, partial [Kineosporiaceae bacterium]|nr:discoidin domain-containing protein [Kineosporiaceae bacterium]
MSTTYGITSVRRRPPRRRRVVGALAALGLVSVGAVVVDAPSASAAATTYYVDAANGADTYDGSAAVRGSGSVGAFRTIQKCASTAGSGDTCLIRKGTYRETVTPNNGVTFKPYNQEAVTVTGLNDVTTAWSQYSGNIYKTTLQLPVSGYSDTGLHANQLFAGGAPMLEARWPNTSSDLLGNVTRAVAETGTTPDTLADSHLPAIPGGWAGARIYFRISAKYASASASIASDLSPTKLKLDTSTLTTTTFACAPGTATVGSCLGVGSQYFLYGKLALLDTANEWFYDSGTTTLYAWAPSGSTPTGIEYKARVNAFDLRGKSNVTVAGLAIKGATVTTDASSTNNTLDGLDAQYVSHYMTVPHVASDEYGGIYFAHQLDSGIILQGSGNKLRNSVVAYSAGNGVSVTGTGNTVENNVIHDVNYGANYTSGVQSQGNSTNLGIHHNTIYNTGRDGINVTGKGATANWKNNEVSYNEIFNVGKLSADLGGMYFCCSLDMTGTRIHHNYLNYLAPAGVGAIPLYFDAGSGLATVDHNVVGKGGLVVNGWNPEQGTGTNYGGLKFYNNYVSNVYESYTGNGTYRNNILYTPPSSGTSSNNLDMNSPDPQVVDQDNNDFRVKSTSPAVNAGIAIPGITDGYVGSAPDIGPYEQGDTWKAGASSVSSNVLVSRNAVATASSTFSVNTPASNANDVNYLSRWTAAGTGPEWIQLDFGSAKPIQHIFLQELDDRITSYSLQWWNGASWVNIQTGTTVGFNKTDVYFAPVTTSRVRLLINSASGVPTISHFLVYQAPVLTTATTTTDSVSVDDSVVGTGANQFDYTSGWAHVTGDTGSYNSTNSYTSVAGSTADFRFSGTGVALYSVKGNNHGIEGVSVDGGTET